MNNNKYKVQRQNIYIGTLIEKTTPLLNNDNKLKLYGYIPYQVIIFTIDENNHSNDLLYDTPNYPILNISSNNECQDSKLLIHNIYSLEELLTYFNYNEILTIKDIIKIKKHFFNKEFINNNSNLFGYKIINPKDKTYYDKKGNIITNKLELHLLSLLNKQEKEYIGNEVLPKELFDTLIYTSNNDMLKPYETEKIKKLKKIP